MKRKLINSANDGAGTPTWGEIEGDIADQLDLNGELNSLAVDIDTLYNEIDALPHALTKVDDTNVTLTLGGTPSLALLEAVTLTLAWSGQLDVTRGGTGLASLSQGDLLYGSAVNTFAKLAKNTSATRYLSNTGTSNNPAWSQINLANGVTGALPWANITALTSDGSLNVSSLPLIIINTGHTNSWSVFQQFVESSHNVELSGDFFNDVDQHNMAHGLSGPATDNVIKTWITSCFYTMLEPLVIEGTDEQSLMQPV